MLFDQRGLLDTSAENGGRESGGVGPYPEGLRSSCNAAGLDTPRSPGEATVSWLLQVALRIILRRHWSSEVAAASLERHTNGKPYLAHQRRGPHAALIPVPDQPLLPHSGDSSLALPAISLSHTSDLGLVVVSDTPSVGCDLQLPRPFDWPQRRLVALRKAHADFCWQDIAWSEVQLADWDSWHVAPRSVASADDPLSHWVDLEAQAKTTGVGIFRLLNAYGVLGAATAPLAGAEKVQPARRLAFSAICNSGKARQRSGKRNAQGRQLAQAAVILPTLPDLVIIQSIGELL